MLMNSDLYYRCLFSITPCKAQLQCRLYFRAWYVIDHLLYGISAKGKNPYRGPVGAFPKMKKPIRGPFFCMAFFWSRYKVGGPLISLIITT